MAFTVQNDQGTVAGANAYVTVAEFKAYHTDRGNSWSTATDTAIEQGIVKATDYLDYRFRYVGNLLNIDQTTEWPRVGAFNRSRFLVAGIPDEIKQACSEYALRALSAELNPDPERDASGRTVQSKSEAVGPISESVTYVAGAVLQMPAYPAADRRLISSGLTRSGNVVVRG